MSVNVHVERQCGEQCDFNDFDHGMVAMVKAMNRNLRLHWAQMHQNWTIEKKTTKKHTQV